MTVAQCTSHPWLSDILDSNCLSQLSEADSADSGYSTDMCSGSPPSPGSLPNGFVSDLCQFSIPEDRQVTTHQTPIHAYSKQFCPHHQLHRLGEDEVDRGVAERRPRISSAHLSVNVIECLQSQQRPQARPLRRSSLVIPRNADEYEPPQSMFENTEPHRRVSFFDYDENQNSRSSLCPSHMDSELSSNLNGWNHSPINSDCTEISGQNQLENNSLLTIPKPWNKICYGSYNRALNQLKSPKKTKAKTNLGLRPELSCSMFELKPSYDNILYPDLRSPKHELRKCKAELRASKKDLRNKEISSPRSELRHSKNDLRGSTLSLDVSNMDNMNSISDIRGSKTDLRNSKHDMRGSPRYDARGFKSDIRNARQDPCYPHGSPISPGQSNLLSSHSNFASIPYLNMSLSRLDIAHETLDNEESEERDVVYGDCTLPRRYSRNSTTMSPLLRGNAIHMSFRRPKKRDGKI